MKNIIIYIFTTLLLVCYNTGFTQISNAEGVSIANSETPPDESAMLDIQSTNKGMLIPRVPISDIFNFSPVAVVSPTEGLLVYNQTGTALKGFYFWTGNKWQCMSCCMVFDSDAEQDVEWLTIGSKGTFSDGQPVPGYSNCFASNSPKFSTHQSLAMRKINGMVQLKGEFTFTCQLEVVSGELQGVGYPSLFNPSALPSGYQKGGDFTQYLFEAYSPEGTLIYSSNSYNDGNDFICPQIHMNYPPGTIIYVDVEFPSL